jgi:hypothetical protein
MFRPARLQRQKAGDNTIILLDTRPRNEPHCTGARTVRLQRQRFVLENPCFVAIRSPGVTGQRTLSPSTAT